MLEFKRMGFKDFMGFSWFGVYRDGKEVLERGVHLQFHALDRAHAQKMYNQFPR